MRADWAAFPPAETLSLPELRAAAEQVRARWTAGGPTMADTVERTIATDAGGVRIRVYRPQGAGAMAPALLYIHGGGFVLFSLDTHDRLMREYAAAAGVVVVGIDYPLSPEARFPVALDRIGAAARWIAAHGATIGVDPRRLAIGGDSAGANLAIATAVDLRGSVAFDAILSNYGFFSTVVSDDAEARLGGADALLHRDELLGYARNYLTHAAQAADPRAFPLSADLAGLPPTLLLIPGLDVLAEQSVAMARRMRAAGVAAETVIYPGATHSFLEAMSIADLARRGIADGAAFLAGHLHR
ncbi:MAG: acetylesterase [Sphingomonas hengshuiensis]|uniref:Acetylesterase n=1 Tax=Sphingomonas hengshuiensis TaxID=1609977 RepID=A0A2W4Z8F1_9SPHN|nr:MAG: acetylesterase [Sphingomonas hengshuiensis]